MAFRDEFRRQVALLVRMLPYVASEDCFALKGGTAINLFVRNMPRLSVDIDLTYLPVAPREESLAGIDAAMRRILEQTQSVSPVEDVTLHTLRGDDIVTRLTARGEGVQIKIEVTPVLRGCVYEPVIRSVAERVEDEFGFAEIQIGDCRIFCA